MLIWRSCDPIGIEQKGEDGSKKCWGVSDSGCGAEEYRFVKNLPGATGGAGEGPTNLGDGYDGPDNKKISEVVADSTWLYVYPEGFTNLLTYVNKK